LGNSDGGSLYTEGGDGVNVEESIALQGMKIAIDSLSLEIKKQRQEAEEQSRFKGLPEWVTLEVAAAVKGGPALVTYKQKAFLRPCCGRRFRVVGGRHCWHRDDVIVWLGITDAELKRYADECDVKLPENYEKRSADQS
jgi:hypothetical protein